MANVLNPEEKNSVYITSVEDLDYFIQNLDRMNETRVVFPDLSSLLPRTKMTIEQILKKVELFIKHDALNSVAIGIENKNASIFAKPLSQNDPNHTAVPYSVICNIISKLSLSAYWYYPIPSLESPTHIFSEDYFPRKGQLVFPFSILRSTTNSLDGPTLCFDEVHTTLNELGCSLDAFLSITSCYWLEITSSTPAHGRLVYYSAPNSRRKPQYQLTTAAYKNSGSVSFRKTANTKDSWQHLSQCAPTFASLKKLNASSHFSKALYRNDSGAFVDFEFIQGDNFENKLLESILTQDKYSFSRLFDAYELFLSRASSAERLSAGSGGIFSLNFSEYFLDSTHFIKAGILDINFDNLILQKDGALKALDYEWTSTEPVPVEYSTARAVMWFSLRYSAFITKSPGVRFISIGDELYIPEYFTERIPNLVQYVISAARIEPKFQKHVMQGRPVDIITGSTPAIQSKDAIRPIFYPELLLIKNRELEQQVTRATQALSASEQRLERILKHPLIKLYLGLARFIRRK